MTAALKITLTPEEDRTLKELELADLVPTKPMYRVTDINVVYLFN